MRYLLFGGDFYYGKGGANDFIKASANKNELIELGKKKLSDEKYHLFKEDYGIDWWHVFDSKLGKIIAGTKDQAYHACDLPDDVCVSI